MREAKSNPISKKDDIHLNLKCMTKQSQSDLVLPKKTTNSFCDHNFDFRKIKLRSKMSQRNTQVKSQIN